MPYMHVMPCMVCALYGWAGGADGPLVAFLSHMGKQYGENATIGSEMVTALVDVSLSKTNLYVMTRNASVMTNMTVGKVVDGIAKLVTKTDFMGLKAKRHEENLLACEKLLEDAWVQTTKAQIDTATGYKIFGLAALRVTLYLFKKEKQGQENTQYTLDQIETMFKDDLAKGSLSSMSTPSASSKATPPEADQAVSITEGKDSMFLAKKQLGLQQGSLFTVKDFGNRVWVLEEITSTEVKLVHFPLLEPTKKMTVKIEAGKVLSNIKVCKGKPPTLFEDDEVSKLFPSQDTNDVLKCQAYQALHEVYDSEDLDVQDMHVQKYPKVTIYAKKNIKVKGLKLIPVPEKVSNLVTEEPKVPKYGKCIFQNTTVYILPPKPLKFPKVDDQAKEVTGMFAPYWSCMTKDEDGSLEVKAQTFKTSMGDIEIYILTNNKALDAHQALLMEDKKGSKGEGDEPAKKKVKK